MYPVPQGHCKQVVQGRGHLECAAHLVFFDSGGVQSQAPQGRQPWAEHAWSPRHWNGQEGSHTEQPGNIDGHAATWCRKILKTLQEEVIPKVKLLNEQPKRAWVFENTAELWKVMSWGVPVVAQWWWTQLVSMRTWAWSLASLSGCWGSGVAMSCGVGWRHGSDPTLLWLWCRPAAEALIGPLARKLPYAVDVALKRQKKKKKLCHKKGAKDLLSFSSNISRPFLFSVFLFMGMCLGVCVLTIFMWQKHSAHVVLLEFSPRQLELHLKVILSDSYVSRVWDLVNT